VAEVRKKGPGACASGPFLFPCGGIAIRTPQVQIPAAWAIPVHGLGLYRLLRLLFLLQDSLDAIPVPVRHDLHGARMLLDRRRADFRLTPWHRHGQGHRRPQGCEGGRAVLEGERKGRP